MGDLGRLKRTLKERCSFCNKPLQERVREVQEMIRGEFFSYDEPYIYCPVCETETEMKDKRRKPVVEKIWDGKI